MTMMMMMMMTDDDNGDANVPHLQPMAELRRKQRGEIECQHVKAPYVAASIHVRFRRTHPNQ